MPEEPVVEPYLGWATEKTTVQTPEGTPWEEGKIWPNLDTVNGWLKEQGGLKLSPDLERQWVRVRASNQSVVDYHAVRDVHRKKIQDAFNASLTGTLEERLADPMGDYLDHQAFEARIKGVFQEDSGG